MNSNPTINSINEKIVKCTKCDLCQNRKNAVPGIGNENADIVFIGEAPGRSEDKYGKPFIGSAGKKLDEALKYAGLTREEVYITNIVKCRPPKNRVPSQHEKVMCSIYLEKELLIINPKIVCLMGNTAYHSILNGKEISKNHGKIVDKDNKTYFVTFHPAAMIYNKKLDAVFKNDIKKLVKIVKNLKKNDWFKNFTKRIL